MDPFNPDWFWHLLMGFRRSTKIDLIGGKRFPIGIASLEQRRD
jgi:hypothetical protein